MTYASTGLRTAGPPRASSRALAALSSIGTAFARALTLWTNRRSIYRLAQLEDRYLSDIGLTRADVDWALAQPWPADPSLELASRVSRRRAARQWADGFNK